MIKLALVGVMAAGALALSACSGGGFESTPDWDMNHSSTYNDSTYCNGGTYNPLQNNQYSCTRNGITSAPLIRPAPVKPPTTQKNSTSGGSGGTVKKDTGSQPKSGSGTSGSSRSGTASGGKK